MHPLTRPSLLLFTLIVLGLSPQFTATLAAASEDTNTIESLTPGQARKLARTFQGVGVGIEIKGSGKVTLSACLPLNGLKSVDAKLAEALAGYRKGPLLLNGLTTLSAEAAQALAQHTGRL